MRPILRLKVSEFIITVPSISMVLLLNFHLSEKRDGPAARVFFNKATLISGLPSKVVIHKNGTNTAALDTINIRLWLSGYMLSIIEVLAIKYLNNIVEQSHRKMKGKIHQCFGWKFWSGARTTLVVLNFARCSSKDR